MNKDIPTVIFESTNSGNITLSILCILIAGLALGFVVYNNRRPVSDSRQQHYRSLISMLLGFVALIGIGTAVFSWLTAKRLDAVVMSEAGVLTSEGLAKWDNIDRIYFHEDRQVQPFTGNEVGDPVKMLMIIEKVTAKTHVLSEEHFNIEVIGDSLKSRLEQLNRE